MSKVEFLSPVGRLVMGSPYKPSTKDADGNLMQFKSGANAGQPRVNYFLGLAIQKGAEQHWSQTPWGLLIYQAAAAAFPQAVNFAKFSFKVTDGDDTTPNDRNKRPCDNEGFPGHWVIKFTSAFAPSIFREENGAYAQVTEDGYIRPGYYIRIYGSIIGNNSQSRPGVIINHDKIAFVAYGQEIHFGKEANEVFGAAPVSALPAGASAVPLASAAPMLGSNTQLPPAAPVLVSNVQLPPVAVVPNHAFLQVPPAVPVPVATVAAPLPPVPVTSPFKMTAKANGVNYEVFRAGGWSDELLVAQGYATR